MKRHIIFNKETKTFYLHTRNTSYVFYVNEMGDLEHLYYGGRIPDDDMRHLACNRSYSFAPFDASVGEHCSPDAYFREYSIGGSGDFRICATQFGGVCGISPKYVTHKISKGKETIPDLPSARGDGTESLEITLEDREKNIRIVLYYTVYPDCDAITRRAQITNCGQNAMRLHKAMSLSLDLPDREYEKIDLAGTYMYERATVQRVPLAYGKSSSFSQKGCSGHHGNPFVALCSIGAAENCGEVYGFNLVYSGNYETEIEVNAKGSTRIICGMGELDWTLKANDSFYTPEAVCVFSNQGIGGMSRLFHDFIREHIVPQKWAHAHRPVAINTWETCYFNVSEEKIMGMVQAAKEIGSELLVLDDGWFRPNDKQGLGDWKTDTNKFPSGLKKLSEELHKNGLGFGLWFEPEMVSPNSDLFRAHPEYAVNAGKGLLGRHQLVLDMSNRVVEDYVFDKMANVIDGLKIEYLKWDMNRYISEPCGAGGENGAFCHRYILGVYSLLRRITKRYPDLLIESCAGGGGRFDLGMLCYCPQIWTSDNTDPFNRIAIQTGTSVAYPNSAIVSHVTHGVVSGVNASLGLRCATAAFGPYGYEFDPVSLSKEDRIRLKSYKEDVCRREDLMLCGDLYRLLTTDKFIAYSVVAKDKTRAMLTFIQLIFTALDEIKRVRLCGLNENAYYTSSADGKTYSGAALMNAGLVFDGLAGAAGKVETIEFTQIKQ